MEPGKNAVRITLKEKGKMSRNEDWWYLVFDPDSHRLFVEHEWSYLGSGSGTSVWPLEQVPESEAWLQQTATEKLVERFRYQD